MAPVNKRCICKAVHKDTPLCQKEIPVASEKAQSVKCLACKCENLSSTSRIGVKQAGCGDEYWETETLREGS